MAEEETLKLGKGVAFLKSRLKPLPQADDSWEADFQALPKPMGQGETHYLGQGHRTMGASQIQGVLSLKYGRGSRHGAGTGASSSVKSCEITTS